VVSFLAAFAPPDTDTPNHAPQPNAVIVQQGRCHPPPRGARRGATRCGL